MTGVRCVRTVAAATVIALALFSVGPSVAAQAAAKAPHLVVTPVKGLKNGSVVKVSGSGFTPKDTIYIVQCRWKSTGEAGCKVVIPPLSVTVSASGTIPVTKFKVTTGAIGNAKCGTKKSNLNNCEVSAGNATGGDSASVRIQFVMPK
jgi:hypothetical protein